MEKIVRGHITRKKNCKRLIDCMWGLNCTKTKLHRAQNCTKIHLHDYKFALWDKIAKRNEIARRKVCIKSQFCTKSFFCTKIKIKENTVK